MVTTDQTVSAPNVVLREVEEFVWQVWCHDCGAEISVSYLRDEAERERDDHSTSCPSIKKVVDR